LLSIKPFAQQAPFDNKSENTCILSNLPFYRFLAAAFPGFPGITAPRAFQGLFYCRASWKIFSGLNSTTVIDYGFLARVGGSLALAILAFSNKTYYQV
jgi:hypothetical protein